MIRNKKMHYRELPANIQNRLGALPINFLKYFDEKFPKIMLVLYTFAATYFSKEMKVSSFFSHGKTLRVKNSD